MAYELITKHTAFGQSDRSAYGWHGRPVSVTHHWWNLPALAGDFESTIKSLVANRNASAHYVVSGKRVACLISPDRAAWHSGSTLGNGSSIGIEIDPRLPEGTLETVAELCADLERHYGELKHFGHKDWSATMCPGVIYDRIGWIINRTNEILAGNHKPARISTTPSIPANNDRPAVPAVTTAPDQAGPYWTVERGDTLSKIARYYFGKATAETIGWLVTYNNLGSANAVLKLGQKIFIPGPLTWTVQPGDTWEKIDGYYGYAPGAVASRNPGVQLTPGVVLKVWG